MADNCHPINSVSFDWNLRNLSFLPNTWIYSNEFKMFGINNVTFKLRLRSIDTNTIQFHAMKDNHKLAKADVKITIDPKDVEVKVDGWKEICDLDCTDVDLIHNFSKTACSYSIDAVVTCKIIWYGFVKYLPEKNFLQSLRQFHTSKSFSDVVLIIGNEELPSHKIILSAHSPVLHAMLTTVMKEGKENRIEIKNFTADIIAEMLEYFYSGETAASKDVGAALRLLEVADMYQVQNLKNICEETLRKNINFKTVLCIIDVADDYDLPELRKQSMNFILENSKRVVELEEFKTLFFKKPQLMFEFTYASAQKN
ncbi:kelch-like protein 7 [Microplitis demolitor]|uniref:kelch-like protein 7 n=1 Tax=Microplitis demolitor TaxID=69319 RepID=UPI0004CD7823|nr:kelch-like protein 7 [Microplitis demolitor]XP_014300772.1 kelch-like protein 7 [Microplitis demolitor]